MKVPRILRSFAKPLLEAGYECHLVGGAVRNMILGIPPGDFDLATDAQPELVQRLYTRVIPTGIRHGTVTVIYRGHHIEVTTYRAETGYADARRPDSVKFIDSIEQDLLRRDFTINAIALNCETSLLVDPSGGRDDLRRGVLKAVGDPRERFREDGLRLIRACRLAAQLEFKIEEHTLVGMRSSVESLRGVSAERIQEELFKLLGAEHPSIGFLSMAETGVLSSILPELEACRGVEQKGMHLFDVFTHSILACEAAPRESAEVRMAALLHDIGKPGTKQVDENGFTSFHRHEELSAELAREILNRLKCSKSFEESVIHLILHHMFHYEPNWSDAAVRRFVHRARIEHLERLFDLRRADSAAIKGTPHGLQIDGAALAELRERISSILEAEDALTLSDLAVNGHDLNTIAGIPRTKEMGVVLAFLLESVLDDPQLNSRDRLLSLAKKYYEERMRPDG